MIAKKSMEPMELPEEAKVIEQVLADGSAKSQIQINDYEKALIDQIVLNKVGQQLDEKFKEWKAFTFQNRTIDTMIAFTLGVAFSKLVTAFSEGLIMPFVQFFGTYTGESWREIVWAPLPNLTFEVGQLYAASVDFLLTSLVLFGIWKLLRKIQGEDQREQGNECHGDKTNSDKVGGK